ncbi:hypothetical protein HDZ31DRAFT_38390 [Schizophyllum fasciatum]
MNLLKYFRRWSRRIAGKKRPQSDPTGYRPRPANSHQQQQRPTSLPILSFQEFPLATSSAPQLLSSKSPSSLPPVAVPSPPFNSSDRAALSPASTPPVIPTSSIVDEVQKPQTDKLDSLSRHRRTQKLPDYLSTPTSLAPPVNADVHLDLQRRLASLEAENQVLENNRQAFSNAIENLERAKLDQQEDQDRECAGIELRVDFGRRQIEIFETREAALRSLCERMLRLTGYDPILLSAYDTVCNANMDPKAVLATHIQIAIQNGLDNWHQILPAVTGRRLPDDYEAVDRLKRHSLTEAEQEYKTMKLWRAIAKDHGDDSITPSVSNVSSLGGLPLSSSRQFAVDSLLDRYREGSMPPRRISGELDLSIVARRPRSGTVTTSASSETVRPSYAAQNQESRGGHSDTAEEGMHQSSGVLNSDPPKADEGTIALNLDPLPSDSQLYRSDGFGSSVSDQLASAMGDSDATPRPQTFDSTPTLDSADWASAIDAIQGFLASESPPLYDGQSLYDLRQGAAPDAGATKETPTSFVSGALSSSSSRCSSISATSTRRRRTSITFATNAASRPAPQMPPKRRSSRSRVNVPVTILDHAPTPPPLPGASSAAVSRPASILRMPQTVDANGSFGSNMANQV